MTDLGVLYATEHDRLRRLLIRRGVSAAEAAEMVHDAFVRMLRAPVNDVQNPRSYLFRTAGNIAVDEHRRRVRTERIFDVDAGLEVSAAEVADPAPQPDEVLIASEEIAALYQALAELPPRCRETLVLHKFEGLSYAEIAERLGIAKNTVTVNLARAIATLRRRMRERPQPTR